jgi:1-acyl-sn-glycerol-3-phosphate acyltransferase
VRPAPKEAATETPSLEQRRHPELPAPDHTLILKTHRITSAITDVWFRPEVRHLERVPEEPTLLVGNHDGGNLPVDGICFAVAWHRYFNFLRPLRVMMHSVPFHMTAQLRNFLHGIGCVEANAANFEALAAAQQTLLLYPGAARESFRTYLNRRNIDLGGRRGFIVRALRNRLPITPVVSAGAHETMFILVRGQRLARFVGLDKSFKADVWPLTFGFPLGFTFGAFMPHIPLPAKITIEVLEPIRLEEELEARLGRPIGPESADDPEAVQAGFDLVLAVMRDGLRRLYAERRFPVIG